MPTLEELRAGLRSGCVEVSDEPKSGWWSFDGVNNLYKVFLSFVSGETREAHMTVDFITPKTGLEVAVAMLMEMDLGDAQRGDSVWIHADRMATEIATHYMDNWKEPKKDLLLEATLETAKGDSERFAIIHGLPLSKPKPSVVFNLGKNAYGFFIPSQKITIFIDEMAVMLGDTPTIAASVCAQIVGAISPESDLVQVVISLACEAKAHADRKLHGKP